jgi:hypothetical protein
MHNKCSEHGCAGAIIAKLAICPAEVCPLFVGESDQNSSPAEFHFILPMMRLCGLHHRQRQCRCATTYLGFQRIDAVMPSSKSDSKLELERLRLASDLRQLAKEKLNPDLREHCLRMAEQWSGEVDKPGEDDPGSDKDLGPS